MRRPVSTLLAAALIAALGFGLAPSPASASPTTSVPTGTVRIAAHPAWQPNTAYAVGARVSYGGKDYECLQSHTSLTGWEPSSTPALWKLLGDSSGGTDTAAPSTPTGLRATGSTSSSVSLAWNASTDNVGVTGYLLYRDGSQIATTAGTSYTVGGLAPGTAYTFAVRARDAAGNTSSASGPATVTTPGGTTPGSTPAQVNGRLKVCGVQLCNQYGRPIQLRGMSSHGLQWYGHCLTDGSLDALAGDWNADVLRISLYVQEGGYETNPRMFTDRVHQLIEMATARGMYALVDWHQLTPGDPHHNLDRAKTFFTEIAQRHRGKTNLLYDIANEPNGVSWSRIKSYAEQLIPVIRAQDPATPILIGTHGWGSLGVSDGRDETDVINNPVQATNIMYTFHFYAASHGQEYLNALDRASDRIPVFVTEFGTQEASGDGADDFARAQQYLDLMGAKKISWVNWNFSDDHRSGAVFKAGTCDDNGPWAGTNALKPAGVWVRDRIRTPDSFPTA
ncbi:cellulase family glycosylhydrolase [Streptomyces broussonetiae]|uniref:cellulase n=1 Tax=Streptomyces broussonetiae TaxID=2686304 RepID=A0ABV5EIM5_9ACTN